MADVLQLYIDRIDTPIGDLLLVSDAAGKLRAVDWSDHEARMLRFLTAPGERSSSRATSSTGRSSR